MADLQFALRQMLKDPGFTTAAALTLALGIGANTTMFSVVNGVLLKPLRYDEPAQLVQVWEAPDAVKRNSVSPGVFLDWRQESKTFDGLAAVRGTERNLTETGEPERLSGMARVPLPDSVCRDI
jgi:putative ABC transport system permease protein